MMNNYQMVGFHKMDNFDMKMSLTVIAAFGVITLVSYFNELARAGLLTKRNAPAPLSDQVQSRHVRTASALIQSNKQLHKLNLDIRKIKDTHHVNKGTKSKKHQAKHDEQINFELRLNKNKDYEKSNGSKIQIYSHKNTLANFYTNLVNNSLYYIGKTQVLSSSLKVKKFISKAKLKYMDSSVVLMYQHEPGGHFFKDCFKYLAYSSNMSVAPGISASYRKEWEAQSQRQKDNYKYLYGGVSFGICEHIKHKCLYSIIVSHPIDRLLQTYTMCRKNSKKPFCHFHKLNLKNISLIEFIKVQGNRLFQRLLYYNKHCRLLGEDEICLNDIKTSFVLTNREYKAHLHNILQNIENWFAVIGLVDHLNQSLAIFDSVLDMNMSATCSAFWNTQRKPKWYMKQREMLLADERVKTWLHADLAIYSKLTQVFQKQLQLMQLYNNVTLMNKTKANQKQYVKTKLSSHFPEIRNNNQTNMRNVNVAEKSSLKFKPVKKFERKSVESHGQYIKTKHTAAKKSMPKSVNNSKNQHTLPMVNQLHRKESPSQIYRQKNLGKRQNGRQQSIKMNQRKIISNKGHHGNIKKTLHV